jgi:cation:H+ antiporter
VPGIASGTMNLLLFLLGLAALVAGASLLVRGAAKLALSFGSSPPVVGLTIVAFGISAPELAFPVGAALDSKTAIAIGGDVGRNTSNILGFLEVVMQSFVLPLTIITLLVVMYGHRGRRKR